jgi:hypothetical protein
MLRKSEASPSSIDTSAQQVLALLDRQHGGVQCDDAGATLAALRVLCTAPQPDAEQRKLWDVALSLALCGDAHAAAARASTSHA